MDIRSNPRSHYPELAGLTGPEGRCALCLGTFGWDELAEHAGCCGECAAAAIRCRAATPGELGGCPNLTAVEH